jgi:tRNA(Arg) A34 adenosine deaminase TadA
VWEYLEIAGRAARPFTDNRRHQLGVLGIRQDGAIVISRNGAVYNGRSTEKVPSAHAEYRALRKAGVGSILFVARVKKNGDYALAKPCVYCEQIIRSRKVKRVYYTISNDKYGVWDLLKDQKGIL